jgi:hypothetical protein
LKNPEQLDGRGAYEIAKIGYSQKEASKASKDKDATGDINAKDTKQNAAQTRNTNFMR